MSRALALSLFTLVALGGALALHFAAAPARPTGPPPEDSGPLVPLGHVPPVASAPVDPAGTGGGAALVAPDRTEGDVVGTGDTTVVFPLRVELSLASRASVPRTEDSVPFRAGAVAGVEGTVTGKDGEPAVGAKVTFIGGPNIERALLTDSRGRYGATDLWEGLSLVRIEHAGLVTERPLRLRRLGRTPLSVDFRATVWVGAIVRDAAGRPIEGAEVRVDGLRDFTTPEGEVRFPNVTVGKVMTSVRKEGFAAVERELSLSRETFVEPDQNVYTLRRGASLAVHVLYPGNATVPAQLYLLPAGGAGGSGGNTLREFPWHEVSPIEVPLGRTVTIPDLPEDMVQLRLFYAGAKAEPATMHQRLHAGQVTTAELRLTSAPSLIGKVLQGGRPVAGARVSLEAANRDHVTTASLDKKPMYAEELVLRHTPQALQRTVTDSRGSFVLTAYEGLEEGRYLLAESPDGRWRAARLVRAAGADLVLELAEVPAVGGQLEVELAGRFQGLPVEVTVDGRPRDPRVLRPGEPFVVDDLEHGTWRVHAVWEGQEVVMRREVTIGPEPVKVAGTLPEGALRGQTEDVRKRAQGG